MRSQDGKAAGAPSPRPELAALRARVAAIERGGAERAADAAVVRFGAEDIDQALPGGGLARGALHEIGAAPDGAESAFAAACGFAAALAARAVGARGTLLWCAREGGLYAPGLAAFGLEAARLLAVRAPRAEDALWTLEEALRAGVPAAVGEAAADATASRRLQLAARAGGGLCLLLPPAGRPARAAAAATRWRIAPLPSAPRPGGGPGAPRWKLSLTRCRGGALRQGGAPRDWTVEWRHETHRFSLVTPLANRAAAAGLGRTA